MKSRESRESIRESIDELTNELIELETKKKSFLAKDQKAEHEFDDYLDNNGDFEVYKILGLEFDPSEILYKMDPMFYRDQFNSWCPNQIPYIDNEITRLTEELDRHSKDIEGCLVMVVPKKEYDEALENITRSEYLIGDSFYFVDDEDSLYIEIEEYSFYVRCPGIPKDFSYEEVEVFIEQIKEGIRD